MLKILRFNVIYIVQEIAIGFLHLESRIYDHKLNRKNWLATEVGANCASRTYYKSFRMRYIVEIFKDLIHNARTCHNYSGNIVV